MTVRQERVVVTGAGGLAGRAVCTRLAQLNVDVMAVARHQSDDPARQLEVADLTIDRLEPVVDAYRPTAIVHCAALVPTNPEHPDTPASADGTRAIDENVYTAARATGARVVYVSSCGLYDPGQGDFKTEASPIAARSPYFEAKQAGETLFGSLAGSVVMRLSGPVGPGMRANLVLPRFLAAALRGEELTLWGSGQREQDFVDVRDVAEFVGLAVGGEASGVFNVAAGSPVTMRGLADAAVSVAGKGSVALADRPDPMEGDTARYSIDRARGLGWAPKVDLDTMVRGLAADLRASG